MVQAWGIGDDEGRAGIGFRFGDGLEGLFLAGAHGDLRHVHVAVAHGHEAQIFLAAHLAVGGELRHSPGGRGLGRLAAGVGIDFGVEDEDVDVFPP